MRVMDTDTADNAIMDLKCIEEGGVIRLTFRWPAAIEQVYIFKTDGIFDIEAADEKDARLFTSQEYKKQAGFIDRKTPGTHTYHVYPFIREGGCDIAVTQKDGRNTVTCLTGQITVNFSIREKRPRLGILSQDKINEISIVSDQYVEADVLCYVKKENGYPADIHDGVMYFLNEPLSPGISLHRQIKTRKNEYLRIFIRDQGKVDLYRLQIC